MNIREIAADFRAMQSEYAYNPDIFSPDDERIARLKLIIDTKLSQADRTIILLYAECGSYRKLGAILGFSHMTIRDEVLRIKKIIIQEYAKQ